MKKQIVVRVWDYTVKTEHDMTEKLTPLAYRVIKVRNFKDIVPDDIISVGLYDTLVDAVGVDVICKRDKKKK